MEDVKATLLTMLATTFGETIAHKAGTDATAAIFFSHSEGPSAAGEDYLDSLDRIEFIMQIEDHYSIDIPDTLASGFRSIDDLATYVHTVTSGPLHGAH